MTSKYTINLDETVDYHLRLVGGKAATLGYLLRAGFPVPDGFVLPSTLFHTSIQEQRIEEEMENLTAEIERTSTDSPLFKKLGEQLRGVIRQTSILKEAFEDISQNFYKLIGSAPPAAVAVRSSAAVEDSPSASAAGQFSTFLNIDTKDALEQAILDCWMSLYSDRSLWYRKRKAIPFWPPQMGVIVQLQVPADISGIVFTAHPQLGSDWLIVECSWGFGELIVGGRITPDTFEVHRGTGQIKARCGSKKAKLILQAGKLIETDTDALERTQLSLNAATLKELTEMCLRVEALLGCYQDIEFAITQGRIYILQSRPITTL